MIQELVPDAFVEEITIENTTYDIPDEIVELASQLATTPPISMPTSATK